jgi:hypothetical protein
MSEHSSHTLHGKAGDVPLFPASNLRIDRFNVSQTVRSVMLYFVYS